MTDVGDPKTTIPIVEETATIATRAVERERVRIRTVVEENVADIVAGLAREDIEVERGAVDREVTAAPEPYEEGELLIIPIVEERAVVQTRLFVVEELVVRRIARTEDVRIPTTLRKMRAIIERDEPA